MKRIAMIFGLAMIFASAVNAQLTIGAGFAGMKYLGDGSSRPIAGGYDFSVGIDLGEKTQLVLTPTIYYPLTYRYQEILNTGTNTATITSETYKTVQASALFSFDLIGNTNQPLLYLDLGTGVAFYNATVTRDNVIGYNYASNFHDYLLEARVGTELPFLGPVHLFGEAGMAPAIVSDFKGSQYFQPHRSTMLMGSIGLRLRL